MEWARLRELCSFFPHYTVCLQTNSNSSPASIYSVWCHQRLPTREIASTYGNLLCKQWTATLTQVRKPLLKQCIQMVHHMRKNSSSMFCTWRCNHHGVCTGISQTVWDYEECLLCPVDKNPFVPLLDLRFTRTFQLSSVVHIQVHHKRLHPGYETRPETLG